MLYFRENKNPTSLSPNLCISPHFGLSLDDDSVFLRVRSHLCPTDLSLGHELLAGNPPQNIGGHKPGKDKPAQKGAIT